MISEKSLSKTSQGYERKIIKNGLIRFEFEIVDSCDSLRSVYAILNKRVATQVKYISYDFISDYGCPDGMIVKVYFDADGSISEKIILSPAGLTLSKDVFENGKIVHQFRRDHIDEWRD